ncbi:MAG: DNA methyltransferase, partial [Polyangiaceae bacterium]
MAELVWPGKSRESGRARTAPGRVPVCITDEVHGELRGQAVGHPPNRLILGDAARALHSLSGEFRGRVPLIYIDPPFDTGSDFAFQASIHDAAGDATRAQVHAYRDQRGQNRWLAWFSGVAARLHDLLEDGGSLYVHLDAHMSHYAKVLLDGVFGANAFQREIVWRIGWISGYKSRSRGWIRNHDTLLFYAKGGRPRTFHKEYVPYPPGYLRRDGKAPSGQGLPIDDVWNGSALDRMDSIQIVSFSGEKVGYPTQKNEALVARIVRASSNPGDVVLDCFVGSGTTAVVSEKLGRRWIACDSSPVAIHATRARLLTLPRVNALAVQRVASTSRSSRNANEASFSR